jgi:hypothetical protein
VGVLGLGIASAAVAPEPVVPDLVGRELGEARAVLAEQGLSAVVRPEGVDLDSRSMVVEQDPLAGTPADRGMDVLLFVEPLVEVPDLRGLTEDQARRIARSVGLSLIPIVSGQAERVTGQELEPGSLVPVGTELLVFLEVAPEPTNVIPLLVGGVLVLVTAGGLAGRAARRARQRRWVRENVRVRVVPSPPTVHVGAAESAVPPVRVLVRPRTGSSEVHIRTPNDPEAGR